MIIQPTLAFIGIPMVLIDIVMYIALVLTVISLVDYLYKNRGVLL